MPSTRNPFTRSIKDEKLDQLYIKALKILLQGCPERLVMLDEARINASRRKRAWGKGYINAGSMQWTLMASADINGFLPSSCHILTRDDIEEGETGLMADYFVYWVREYVCPFLGNHEMAEPRSVVLIDISSKHMTQEVEDVITSTGAVVLYLPPCSPHMNPVEKYISSYKTYLQQNNNRMKNDWMEVHYEALQTVHRDTGIKFFRQCKIPGSRKMLIGDEYKQFYMQLIWDRKNVF